MSIVVTPHLNFRGNARQALEFYQSAFGGDLVITTYADMGNAEPDLADHVVWGQVTSAAGFQIMAYDVYPHLPYDRGQARSSCPCAALTPTSSPVTGRSSPTAPP